MQYECAMCGHVYDPAFGDAGSSIPVGTSFTALPDDWVCPDCGAAKDDFEQAE
ncbi:MAG: rubredoxin [Armatimonadota bacterium]